MGRKAKLVKRGHGLNLTAAVDENARVPGEGFRIARDGHDEGQSGGGERARLFDRAGAWRIDERGVERSQFLRLQWTTKEIARLGLKLAQARRRRQRRG